MIHKPLPRRTLLRGLGTAVGLPLLEAMGGRAASAAAPRKAPLRMGFFYVPNGVHMQSWTPQNEGPLEALPPILQPLSSVKDQVLLLSGLTCDKARPNGDGPGDHARSAAAFLTGCQARKTPGADIKVGISVDQFAAQSIGKNTRFPSLELGIERGAQAGACDSGYSCAYSSNIAWSSENTPVAKEVDPRLVFERLFGSGDRKEAGESLARRERYRQSILDFVLEDANRLKSRLGYKDQEKLDEYLTGVREIEQRLQYAGRPVNAPKGLQEPTGVPGEVDQHLRLMFDLLAVAFQADITRVATFMLANEGSNRNYRLINVPDGHHDLSHHQNDPTKHQKIQAINTFHMTHYAYFIQKLSSMKEGNGTVLDNCVLLYGSGIGDGNRHNHDDLPILVAGRAGGQLKPGRHVRYPRNTPLNNLYLSLLDRMQVQVHSLGDSTGRLPGLT